MVNEVMVFDVVMLIWIDSVDMRNVLVRITIEVWVYGIRYVLVSHT